MGSLILGGDDVSVIWVGWGLEYGSESREGDLQGLVNAMLRGAGFSGGLLEL